MIMGFSFSLVSRRSIFFFFLFASWGGQGKTGMHFLVHEISVGLSVYLYHREMRRHEGKQWLELPEFVATGSGKGWVVVVNSRTVN
jgi:hypothetical protein